MAKKKENKLDELQSQHIDLLFEITYVSQHIKDLEEALESAKFDRDEALDKFEALEAMIEAQEMKNSGVQPS